MTLAELYAYADNHKVVVDAFALDKREAVSLCYGGQCFIALDPTKLTSEADEKTKLAHELGHCVRGAFYNEYAARDIRAKQETKADKWAIQQLVPREELEKYVVHGYREPWELADLFGVNEDFMRKAMHYYRYHNLAT